MIRPATKHNIRARFFLLVEKSDECWQWKGGTGGKGTTQYGVFRVVLGAKHTTAHRISWEMENGKIGDKLVLDHLCSNTLCVNPSHLEPVTPTENRRRQSERKTHCVRGHGLEGENLYVDKRGRRSCRTCRNSYRQRMTIEQRDRARVLHTINQRALRERSRGCA